MADLPSPLDRTQPTTIAEALDVHTRILAVEQWIKERKADVASWAHARAVEASDRDGAAPTWRLPTGTVVLTDPQPRPRVDDPDAFARWYVTAIVGLDPDDPDDRARLALNGYVAHRRRVSVPEDALAWFYDRWTAGDAGLADMADRLGEAISVADEWLVSEDLLGDLLDGAVDGAPDDPRLRIYSTGDDWRVVDRETGERVPGVTVSPPADPVVQFRPSPDAKKRTRAALDEALGRPALTE